MRFSLLLLLLWHSLAGWAAAVVKVEMRDTGYTLGDLMQMRAVITLDSGVRIDANSLPPPGRVTPWMELRTAHMQQEGETAQLDFEWQVFATVENAMQLKLPPIELKTAGGNPQTVVIPAQVFHLSPVLPKPLESDQPRPSLPPFLFDERTPLRAAVACFALALTSITFWLWLTDRLPGFPRNPGPIARLARQLRRRRMVLDLQALRDIHAALNAAAGETLYPDTLPRLFQRAPYLMTEQTEIEQFFRQSWRHFYESGATVPGHVDALVWVERAARAERLLK